MDVPSTGTPEEPPFPLMRFPSCVRNVIYRHALDNVLPNLILPSWMQERPIASSFTKLQLSNRQIYREASYILYESREFSFNIAQRHASFLDGCLLPWLDIPNIQDKMYIHRIKNVVIKANWDKFDWAAIRRFSWIRWEAMTSIVCRELQGFSGLRRLTLDWRAPDPCEVLRPTARQWLSISRYFEELQARRPNICMEVLVWQMIPGSVPSEHQMIRKTLEKYAQELLQATEIPEIPPVPFSNGRYWSDRSRLVTRPNPIYTSHPWPPISNGLSQDPRSLNRR